MRIACLGWGSLIWDDDRNNDKERGEFNKFLILDPKKPPKDSWKTNGPCLPIEFARKSGSSSKKDRRITLIIMPGKKTVTTLWIAMNVKSVEEAKIVLAKREGTGTENIGYWTKDSSDGESKDEIGYWADFQHLEAVVWTNLHPNWNGDGDVPKDVKNVISHIQTLTIKEQKDAEDYIRNTHFQINTEWRNQLEASFTCHSIYLSMYLQVQPLFQRIL